MLATSRIMYETTPVTKSADEALAALDSRDSESRSRREEAENLLTDLLCGGPVAVKDIKRKATDDGISWASIRRAQKTLGIKPARDGYGADGKSIWSLP